MPSVASKCHSCAVVRLRKFCRVGEESWDMYTQTRKLIIFYHFYMFVGLFLHLLCDFSGILCTFSCEKHSKVLRQKSNFQKVWSQGDSLPYTQGQWSHKKEGGAQLALVLGDPESTDNLIGHKFAKACWGISGKASNYKLISCVCLTINRRGMLYKPYE